MALSYTKNYNFTLQQTGASASDKFSMAALNENAQIADGELKKHEDSLAILNGQSMSIGTTIPEAANMDDYKTPGVFCSPTGSRSATLINSPTSAYGFRMEVKEIVADRLAQIVYPNRTGLFYIRNFLSSGWSNWFKFSGEEIVPTETASVEEVSA